MFPYASKRDEGERRAAQPNKPHLPGIGDGMSTLEMALEAWKYPDKVFTSVKGRAKWGGADVFWLDGSGSVHLPYWQKAGLTWEEERTPLRGTYEFEAQANGLGAFTSLPYRFVADVIRQAVAGHSGNYTASANKTFRVTVNVEEIL